MMPEEALWTPTPESMAASRCGQYMRWLDETGRGSFTDYPGLWRWSVADPSGFWRSVWDHFEIVAEGNTELVLDGDEMPDITWFPEARINLAENALKGPDDEIVVVAESQTRAQVSLRRAELRALVARAAAGLRRLGVGEGDRVVAYLPNIPETLIAMLATASIGAIWAVCAPEMGTQSVLDRLSQLEPKVLIAADGYRYGTKDINRSSEVQTLRAGLPTVAAFVHVPYLMAESQPADCCTWAGLLAEPAEPAYVRVPFSTPLWVVFSSGTTGLPKAIVHSQGGVTLEMTKTHSLHMDLGPGDTFFAYATTSWVMWNIQVAALLVGAKIVLFDGDPASPGPDTLWRLVESESVSVFGCGAAFISMFRKAGLRPRDQFDLGALRGIVSTGSPLPVDGFLWVYEAVSSNVLLQSSSGGTDVCTAFVGGTPLLPVHAGEITTAQLGVSAQAFDEHGANVVGRLGELVITAPMPSMPVSFWNDPDKQRYRDTYFDKYPGVWRHGDWVEFNTRGGCVITGRSDGTLNRGGVRLGASEFYAALETISAVADSLIVHIDDAAGGAGHLLLFVVTADGVALDDGLRRRISSVLKTTLSPRHLPDQIISAPEVPYNLTGKKLEIPVKRLLKGEPRERVTSPGTLRNPDSLSFYEQVAAQLFDRVTVSTKGAVND